MEKKHIGIIIFCLVFLALVAFSWKFMREKPQPKIHVQPTPVSAIQLDLNARVDIEEPTVTSDHLLEVHYRWETGPDWTTPIGNIIIFVHLQDEDGVKLCQDDHNPPVKIADWEPGQVYEYSRSMYIPITLIKKKAFVLTGLYDTQNAGTYFAMKGIQKFNAFYRYLGKEFVLLPSRDEYSESLIKYGKGWHGPELDKNGNILRRWMQKLGIGELVNPKTDATLYIHAWIPNDHLERAAEISMSINGQAVKLPEIVNNTLHGVIEIPASQLGNEDFVPFVLETSQIFIPAQDGKSTDDRELGILVKKIMFRGKPDQAHNKEKKK